MHHHPALMSCEAAPNRRIGIDFVIFPRQDGHSILEPLFGIDDINSPPRSMKAGNYHDVLNGYGLFVIHGRKAGDYLQWRDGNITRETKHPERPSSHSGGSSHPTNERS